MANRFEVGIDGNASGLVNATSQATGALTDLDNTANRVTSNVSRNLANLNRTNFSGFQQSLRAGQISLGALQTQSTTTAATLGRSLTVGSNQAANALTNLGRVAQDAPFGFIGIQNNLNPLLESFQRLRAETGSNGAALRALGQSLIGPAGLGIALSVVSAAILFYQQYQQKANKATKEAKTDTDAYIKSLDQLTQAQLKGAENAQADLTTLRLLFSAYQNANLPLKERKEAYGELQKLYPEYFKNIKFEQDASAKTKTAYDNLSNAILATARARAAADLITKNSTRQLENEQKIRDLEVKRLKEVATAQKNLNTIKAGGTGTGAAGFADAAARAEQRANAILSEQNNLKTDTNKLTQNNLQLQKSVNEQILKGAQLTGSVGSETDKTGKKAVSLADIIKDLNKALERTYVQAQSTFGEQIKSQIGAYQSAIDAATDAFGRQSKAVKDLQKEQAKLFSGTNFDLNSGRTPTGKNSLIQPVAPPSLQRDVVIPPAILRPAGKEIEEELTKGMSRAIHKFSEDFYKTLTTLNEQADGTFQNIFSTLTKGLNESLGTVFLASFQKQLESVFENATTKLGKGLSNAVAAAGLLGGIISGATKKSSAVGQGLGGALSGAATGATLGSAIPGIGTAAGAIVGGLAGLLGGIFGAGKAKRAEELQAQQLAESEKQTKLLERANALAYTSSIIGKLLPGLGTLTSANLDAFGNLTATVSGDQLQFILDRNSRKRG